MKKTSILIRITALLFVAAVLFYCKPKSMDPEITFRDAATDTLTIAATRAFNKTSVPGSIYITDAGSQGIFRLDKADKSGVDNTGVLLVTANGERYRREYTGPASTTWFGISTADSDIGPKLQNAVNAVNDLKFPDGSYNQQTPVRIHSDFSIRGNAGSVLINLSQSYVSLLNATDTSVPLKNVLIDGLSWNVTATGAGTYGVLTIDGPSVSNLTIQNCNSTDATATASTNFITVNIQKGKTADGILVQNNYVQAKRTGCEILNLKENNYNVYAGKNISIRNNNFSNCIYSGISLDGTLTDISITNNSVKNCKSYGIEIAGQSHNVVISNNKFEGSFDKLISGSVNDAGHGNIAGGLTITDNTTIMTCTGGIYLANAGAAVFTNNKFNMTGRLELVSQASSGGSYVGNEIRTTFDNAVILDNAPNNTFSGNLISNQNCPSNNATVRAYNSGAINNIITKNIISKGAGGTYYRQELGASLRSIQNVDEAGNPIP